MAQAVPEERNATEKDILRNAHDTATGRSEHEQLIAKLLGHEKSSRGL